jgi:hemerythrin-like domain-containing protein
MTTELADARDMAVVHTMYLRELANAPAPVRAIEAGDVARATVIADHIALVSFLVTQHHTGEDKHVWPYLIERVPGEIPLVHVMEEHHERIHAGLTTINKATESWRNGASAQTRDALADALDHLMPLLRDHLALEVEYIVPLIERHIFAAEYQLIAADEAGAIPPEKRLIVFGMTIYEGAPEVIESMIARLPAGVQAAMRDQAPKAYASYAQEIYGTPTPPRLRPD